MKASQQVALTRLLKVIRHAGLHRVCDIAHHSKRDQHEIGEPCPVEARLARAIKAAGRTP